MPPQNCANEDAAPQDAPRYVTYRELRRYGINFSRKHLLDLMRAGKFPQARQLSANRVAWLLAEILAHCLTRPVARAALFREKKVSADPGNGGADQATTLQPESSP
jgi:predicted DNA-binding transcriptional regulator AlpA